MNCPCCGRELDTSSSLACSACVSTISLHCGMKFCGSHQWTALEEHKRTCESCSRKEDAACIG